MLQRLYDYAIDRRMDWKNKRGTWRCPSCATLLRPGPDKEYETLGEHVSDPNKQHYPLRATWVCPTHACPVSKGHFYNIDGAMCSEHRAEWLDEKLWGAVNSFEWCHKLTYTVSRKWWYRLLERLDPLYYWGKLRWHLITKHKFRRIQ